MHIEKIAIMSRKEQKYKICPECNYFCAIDEEHNYCPYCGDKLVEECAECGESIFTPYASFCSKCGTAYPGREKTKLNK